MLPIGSSSRPLLNQSTQSGRGDLALRFRFARWARDSALMSAVNALGERYWPPGGGGLADDRAQVGTGPEERR